MGRILATLDRLKLADNTLLIVTSDNGGMMDDGYICNDARDAHGHRCNGVLRGHKGDLWEGGHREPFLARWPGKIKPGTESKELIGLVDMLATFAAVAGCALPPDAGSDSFNVLPTLLGEPSSRDHLVLQTNGVQRLAIIEGPWKLIPPASKKGHPELYNLADDLSETENISTTHPQLVAKLSATLEDLKTKGRSRP